MTIICHCRGITADDMSAAFKKVKQEAPEKDVALDDLVPDLGEFVCGGCSRIFERAAAQFNESGEINIFSRGRQKGADVQGGLCSKARANEYTSSGVPDLLSSPIEGAPQAL